MPPVNWQPTASFTSLRQRAKLFQDIRQFFAERGVLEVETPVMSQHTVTDIHISSFQTAYYHEKIQRDYYLQTSPEYAMKRLLAAGSGPIYQMGKAFRNGEIGQQHNPEFTLLEWYRPGFTDQGLMDEINELLQWAIQARPAVRKTYESLFLEHLSIDPLTVSLNTLQGLAQSLALENATGLDDRDTLLQFLFCEKIEPKLGFEEPLFVYDFPASQAALARLHPQKPEVALRFELYIQGLECANGFEELTDAKEQRRRFESDNERRRKKSLPEVGIDVRFIQALESGLPPCSGVALGIDRLLMAKKGTRNIREVVAFPFDIA